MVFDGGLRMTKQKIVMLIITEACNLSCVYCYEHNKTSRKMDFETAKKIIDKELKADDGYDNILIEFFGGEPFLEFELLRKIHEYIYQQNTAKSILCFATTNGTLITPTIKKWLSENRKTMCCGISLDGTPEMHNVNRNNSFFKIDLSFFKNLWPLQSCKMTISPQTIPFLADGILFLSSLGYVITASFAQGVEWDTSSTKVLTQELDKLVRYYANSDDPICDFLKVRFDLLAYPNSNITTKWCGCGKELNAYDVQGNRYPCQGFAPQTLGENLEFMGADETFFNGFVDEGCMGCTMLPICPTCYAANYQRCGDYKKRDMVLCEFNKAIVLASSAIQYQRIVHKNIDDISEEEFLTLHGIKNFKNSNLSYGEL